MLSRYSVQGHESCSFGGNMSGKTCTASMAKEDVFATPASMCGESEQQQVGMTHPEEQQVDTRTALQEDGSSRILD